MVDPSGFIVPTTLSKERVIIVYRMGDEDSRNFAIYYASKHNMPASDVSALETDSTLTWEVDGQMVGIACSKEEILSNEEQFNNEVLIPLRNAINNSSLRDMEIWGVVLGFQIPGGFFDFSKFFDPPGPSAIDPSDAVFDIISSTSRVSRGLVSSIDTFLTFTKQINNRLYNRSVFKRFDADDAKDVIIVSRIDAPTLDLAKQFLDNSQKVIKQSIVNGKCFIDPYSDKVGDSANNYRDSILEFEDKILPRLNIDKFSTSFLDPYTDSVIPFVENDSFVWSWFTDRSGSSFFQETNTLRVFFYNADFDGAETIRDTDDKRWPILALKGGYATIAAAMSKSTIESFLNPSAFFKSLLNGATLGEAYIFSVPHLDWTITFFGDILATVSFPSNPDKDDESVINEDEGWYIASRDLARVTVNLLEKQKELESIRTQIINHDTLKLQLKLLFPADNLFKKNDKQTKDGQLKQVVDRFLEYPVNRNRYNGLSLSFPTINDYLKEKNIQISSLLADISNKAIIEEDNLLDEGWWQFEFILQDDALSFVDYHFKLQVATDEKFTNIIINKNSSSTNIQGWTFEKDKDVFALIPTAGVPASHIGRKVRYTTLEEGEYLTRGTTYYFRVMQIDHKSSIEYQRREFSDIIYT